MDAEPDLAAGYGDSSRRGNGERPLIETGRGDDLPDTD